MVMLYREEKMILYQGDIKNNSRQDYKDEFFEDDFFKTYESKLSNYGRDFIEQ